MATMAMEADSRAIPKSLSNLFISQRSDTCQRCEARVYYAEKAGPVKGVIFHKSCFRCSTCGQHLTMRTYFTSQMDLNDKEIYCSNHAPRGAATGLDAHSVGIQLALRAPKGYEPMKQQILSKGRPQITGDAMHIKQSVDAQNQFQRRYKQDHGQHHFPAFVVISKKEKLHQAQKELEAELRQEEDQLLEVFRNERLTEQQKLKQEMDQEWEVQLTELTAKFDSDTSKKTKRNDKKGWSMKYEKEKDELKKNLTIKMAKKKEAMTLRLQKKEQEETSQLVTEHSKQMLELMKIKQEEIKKEIEKEIMDQKNGGIEDGATIDPAVALEEAMAAISMVPRDLPPPHPPSCRKRDLYYDASVFNDLDEYVFKVAERDHNTFTELVQDLIVHCITDLEKARAIFRWITVKDLNVLDFDDVIEGDTENPMGILRGIKYGTETYHTLFIRLCSFAGLACVEIKGHSKSVGYEPGMKIREETFQNTWNAVLIEKDWWPVQCNWGARHLVLNKDVQEKPSKSKKQDKIRYQYDEHYFLTDPDEFIQEFWAKTLDWQLLERPISLEEFEAMPFVRSVFFHYGLEFERTLKAVINTDNKGGAEVKIRVPEEFARDLVFHYQLRFSDRERRAETEFRGARLERFVFHSLVDGYALFSVHVPTAAAYFLEIFANKIDDTNKIGDDPNATMMPFRLKCACKFKVVCEELVGKMHPLPNCASGEWGPSKGKRHFGITPVTHMTGVVSFDNDTQVRFRMPRQLHFLCKLRMNGVQDSILEKYVSHEVSNDMLIVNVKPPQPGQYGLDIYARPEDAADNHTLAHSCKYLLNCSRVSDPVDLPVSKIDPSSPKMPKEKWGPMPLFEELGLRLMTHREPMIEKTDISALIIELGMTESLKLSTHLLREPDEDYREKVSMKENGKKVKFVLNLTKPGNYLFAIYARRKKDVDNSMQNVYNYMIKFTPEEKESTLKKKGKGKSLFKK